MRYDAWIDAQRKAYPLLAMCETLTVSISGYPEKCGTRSSNPAIAYS